MDWLILLLTLFIAYLIGSIPTGYILVKKIKGIDIRTVGSGSTGATNVKRVLGKKFFFIVMILDMFKGLIPILAVKYLSFMPTNIIDIDIICILTGIILVVGHSKSIYLKFSGGKSVATSVGVLLGLCWQAALLAFLIWIAVVYISKYVSLGSIIALFCTPILMWLFNQPISYIVFTLACALYVSLYLHKENIRRLIAGTENKISFKGE